MFKKKKQVEEVKPVAPKKKVEKKVDLTHPQVAQEPKLSFDQRTGNGK